MYILNILSTLKKMTIKELFIYEDYYKRVGFTKGNTYYSMKRQKERLATTSNQINRENT